MPQTGDEIERKKTDLTPCTSSGPSLEAKRTAVTGKDDESGDSPCPIQPNGRAFRDFTWLKERFGQDDPPSRRFNSASYRAA